MPPCSPATQPRSLQSPVPTPILPSSPGPEATNLLRRPHPASHLQTVGPVIQSAVAIAAKQVTLLHLSAFSSLTEGGPDSLYPPMYVLCPTPDPTLTCSTQGSTPTSGITPHLVFPFGGHQEPQIGRIKPQKCVLSSFWRREGRDQGVSRTLVSETLGRTLPAPPRFWWWLKALACSCLPPVSASCVSTLPSLCACLSPCSDFPFLEGH